MDISATIEAKSDQQNADDYVAGPKTVTINRVNVTKTDQPVSLHLEEFPGKPYKPSKSMRRVLVQIWGPDSDAYVGRKLTLYRDPNVKFGGETVGGLKISHMSHLDKPRSIPLTETRGKKSPHRVQPLADAPPPAPMITREQWQQIATTAGEKSITDPLAWASDTLGRPLDGPQVITADEATLLIEKVKEL